MLRVSLGPGAIWGLGCTVSPTYRLAVGLHIHFPRAKDYLNRNLETPKLETLNPEPKKPKP